MDYLKIDGKVAIVTGAASGIGKATAKMLASYGAKVVIADVNTEGVKVVNQISSNGGNALFVHCDVSTDSEINELIEKTIQNFGTIDILVNNAGIGADTKPFENIANDEWERMIKIDLTGPFKVCRAVIPYMKEKKYGKIINISSGSGLIGCEFCSHYAAAKAGLIGFTQSIAKELAELHINANVIAAPTTDTPMLAETGFDEQLEQINKEIPWGRIAQPEDIASMILYLASDASEYVTGQVLAPNGGRRTPI